MGERTAGEAPAIEVPGPPPAPPPASSPPVPASSPASSPASKAPRAAWRDRAARPSHRAALRIRLGGFVSAMERGDEQLVEAEVLRWSRAWRPLAPLAMCAGAFVMLFQGLRRLWTDWRLILIEALPAMWAWATMLDLKAHVLSGRGFQVWQGPPAIGLVAATVVVTVSAFHLNTVFAFALTEPDGAPLLPAFDEANRHLRVVSGTGIVVGAALGVSAFVVPRWGLGWFTFALGVAVGAQMLASVLVPSRLVGKRSSTQPRRDRMVAGVIAGVLGAVVCAPSYALGRVGIVLLGSHGLVVLGVALLVIGFGLQSGAAGAVKAIKASAKAGAGRAPLPRGTVLGTARRTSPTLSTGDPVGGGQQVIPDNGHGAAHALPPSTRTGGSDEAGASSPHRPPSVARRGSRKEPDHDPPSLLAVVAAQPT